jgi:hypothetical protein
VQAILATAKLEAPPLFKLLAANFRKQDLVFGWFSTNLDPAVAKQLVTPRVPHLMAAYIDPTVVEDKQGKVPLGIEPFNMPLKYVYMANFLETVASRLGRGDHQVRILSHKRCCPVPAFCLVALLFLSRAFDPASALPDPTVFHTGLPQWDGKPGSGTAQMNSRFPACQLVHTLKGGTPGAVAVYLDTCCLCQIASAAVAFVCVCAEKARMGSRHGAMRKEHLLQATCKQGGNEDDKVRFAEGSAQSTGPVPEVGSDASLASECHSKGGVCLLALLDPLDASHQSSLDVLQVLRSLRRCAATA